MAIQFLNNVNADNGVLYVDAINNRVGIGTASPGAKLQIGSATYAPNANLGNNLLQIKSPSGFAYLTIGNGDVANSTSYIGGASGLTTFGSVTDAGATSERMRIDPNGNVGIGTTSPTGKLDVREANVTISTSNSMSDGIRGLKIEGTNAGFELAGSGNDWWVSALGSGLSIYDTTVNSYRFKILNDGNVGIGTTTPTEKLDVSGRVLANAFRTDVNTSDYSVISRSSAGNAPLYVQSADSNTNQPIAKFFYGNASPNQGQLVLNVAKDESYFTNTNVGIGTTSPNHLLDVESAGASARIYNLTSDGNTDLYLTTTGTTGASRLLFGDTADNDIGKIIYRNNGDSMAFETNAGERMRITSGGNVGIGTTSPSEKLEVAGNARITGDVTLSNGNALRWTSDDVRIEGTTAGDNIKFYVANTEILQLAQSGTLATVTGNLRVTGAYYDSNNSAGTSGQVLSSTGTGTDWVDAASGGIGGSGTVNYIPKWSNSSTLTNSGIVETSTLTTINNDSFEYDYSGTTYLNIDGTTGTFLLGQPSTANRVYIHGIQSHLRFYTDNVKAGEFDSNQNFIVNNGNVGIGEVNPAQKLHVIGNSEITGDIFLGRYIFHNDDNNTWLGFPLADTISFRTNGSDRMYINSSGNVGIGTTSPSYKLDVDGVIRGEQYLRLADTAGTNQFSIRAESTYGTLDNGSKTFNYIASNHLFLVGVSEKMRINSSGYVGIGTTNPSQKLDVAGDATFDGRIYTNATALASVGIAGKAIANGWAARYDSNGANYSGFFFNTNHDASMYLRDDSGNTNVLLRSDTTSYLNGGNVGIGTTSPSYTLDVSGDGRFGGTTTSANTALTVKARSGDLGDLRFRFDAAGTLQRSYISDYYTGEASNIGFERNNSTGVGVITFDTSNGSFSPSERMRINSDGNVGIGTTSPGAKLDIFNTGGSAGSLADCQTYSALTIKPYSSVDSKLTFSANGVSTQLIQATNNAGTTGRQISLQPFSGNVGIGVTLPSEKLDVNGSIKASATTDAYKGYIKQNVISYGAEKLESSNYYFFAYNTTSTVTTAQAYNRIVAAYDGRVKKVYIRHSGGSTPTATAVNFKKHTNGTTSSTVYAATVTNTASANMTAYYEFAQTDFSFNAGDLIGLLYQTTDAFGTASKTMGGVAVTITLEYNIT